MAHSSFRATASTLEEMITRPVVEIPRQLVIIGERDEVEQQGSLEGVFQIFLTLGGVVGVSDHDDRILGHRRSRRLAGGGGGSRRRSRVGLAAEESVLEAEPASGAGGTDTGEPAESPWVVASA